MRPAGALEQVEDHLRERERGDRVDREQARELRRRVVGEGRQGARPERRRVVDQQVQAAQVGGGHRQPRAVPPVRDVARNRGDLGRGPARRGAGEVLGPAGVHHHVPALPHQPARQRPPEALGTAGHERDRALAVGVQPHHGDDARTSSALEVKAGGGRSARGISPGSPRRRSTRRRRAPAPGDRGRSSRRRATSRGPPSRRPPRSAGRRSGRATRRRTARCPRAPAAARPTGRRRAGSGAPPPWWPGSRGDRRGAALATPRYGITTRLDAARAMPRRLVSACSDATSARTDSMPT